MVLFICLTAYQPLIGYPMPEFDAFKDVLL